MKIAKKYKIAFLVVAIGISSFLGTLASTMGVDAANNECSSGYTGSTYMDNISYNVSGNVVTYTGAKGLLYSTSFDSTQRPADENGNFTFTIPADQMDSRIIVYFYLTYLII